MGGLALLLAAAAFVITSVVDPNRYRGKLEGIVADLVGRPLVIEGDLKITWFPWLGVRLGQAHLNNLPDMAGPPLAEWESMTVAAKVLPLLQGQVVVDRIRLQSPRVHLRRDAQGHGNWENLGSHHPPSSSAGPSTGPPPQIAGVEIRDGMLDYIDDGTGLKLSLAGLELDMGEWRAGQPLSIDTRFVVHKDSLPPAGVAVRVEAPALAVQLEPMEVRAPQFLVRIAEAEIKGNLQYRQGAGGASAAAVGGGAAVGDTRGAPVTTARGAAVAEAHGSSAIEARGALTVSVPSVRKLANELALNQTLPHDPTALGPLELSTQWSYVDGAVTAKPVTLKLDEVSFNGWVERHSGPGAVWNFELHGDRIDLGRYFNVDSTNKKPFEIPVDTLRAIKANGSVIFDQAQYADTHMSDVRLKLQTPEVQQ